MEDAGSAQMTLSRDQKTLDWPPATWSSTLGNSASRPGPNITLVGFNQLNPGSGGGYCRLVDCQRIDTPGGSPDAPPRRNLLEETAMVNRSEAFKLITAGRLIDGGDLPSKREQS